MFQNGFRLRAVSIFVIAAALFLAGCATSQPEQTTQSSPTQTAVNTPGAAPTTPLPTEPTLMENTPQVEPQPADTPIPAAPEPTAEPVSLINPGFEEQAADGTPAGWQHAGTVEAVLLEDRGHSGDVRLTHKGSQQYRVETSQTVTGLADGWYTLRAWIRSTGGQNEAYIALTCGYEEKRVSLPSTMPGYRWLAVALSNQVSGGACTIRLVSEGGPDTWASFDDIELLPGRTALSIVGADISSLKKSEDFGGVYRYPDGTEAGALDILKDYGMNYARLRVFVDPADDYHNKEKILEIAQRLKSKDIALLVDFHYSDNWADPGKQIKPAAWQGLDFEELKQAVYDHTFDVCSSLVEQGTPPQMVQVGNEINAGLLWPDGDYNNFDNMADLLKAGHQAVKDCSSDTQVMLHIAEGGDNSLARWWFDNITRRDVPFDVIGISYYPFWHGSMPELQANLNDITARYDKDVIVVETAYAFTEAEDDDLENIANPSLMVAGYPYTPEGQHAMLSDIMTVVRGVNGGRGIGIFYWDATWTAVEGNGWDNEDPQSGNAWENQALFDFDDRALPALEAFLNP